MVFSFGDFGYEFFIVISGSVSVQVPTTVALHCDRKELMKYLVENMEHILWKKTENGELLRKAAESEIQARQGGRHGQDRNPVDLGHNDEPRTHQLCILKEVATLGKGKSFGELALIT